MLYKFKINHALRIRTHGRKQRHSKPHEIEQNLLASQTLNHLIHPQIPTFFQTLLATLPLINHQNTSFYRQRVKSSRTDHQLPTKVHTSAANRTRPQLWHWTLPSKMVRNDHQRVQQHLEPHHQERRIRWRRRVRQLHLRLQHLPRVPELNQKPVRTSGQRLTNFPVPKLNTQSGQLPTNPQQVLLHQLELKHDRRP